MLTGAAFDAEAVVVGGSAGAIEVLGTLLPDLPASFGLPVIVVLHLTPSRTSLLPELFASKCALAVREPEDKQPVTPGIWFAPPDYHLFIEQDRTFSLSIDAPVRFSRPSIDVLFESAARAFAPRLLAVVLTGANEDGALGAKAIRELGGLVAVQDPETALSNAMPLAAIAWAAPQIVASPTELRAVMRSASGGRL